jgi:uncharacterized protein (TIGR02646 family)
MILLSRDRSEKAIHANFRGNKRIALNNELLTQQRDFVKDIIKERKFTASRWGAAKKQLFIETKGKCAYCEANTQVVAHGDVEHYRPKSIYWWLAYCYENYLVSCAVCNEVHKKDKFPTLHSAVQSVEIFAHTTDSEIQNLTKILTPDPLNEDEGLDYVTFKTAFDQERPLLVNPYYEDPEKFFAYEADEVLREVAVVPLRPELIPFVEASVDIYGLNRTELLDLRFRVFETYDTHRLTLEDDGISERTRRKNEIAIEQMKQPNALFAGMVRYFDRLYRNN